MRWQGDAILLSGRVYGEDKGIITLLTPDKGKYMGLCRLSPKNKNALQPGSVVHAKWSARLPEHMGNLQLEVLFSPMGYLLNNPLGLLGLSSLMALLEELLPERNPYPVLYASCYQLLDSLRNPDLCAPEWLSHYCFFEKILLEELGYGLHLESCAATGQTSDLIYMSPQSGRAVSREAGEPYKSKLLPFPSLFKLKENEYSNSFSLIKEALDVTGYYIAKHLLVSRNIPARERLLEKLRNLKEENI